MGPTAGMFDNLFFNCLRIIAAGIGIGLAQQGNILGMVMFILIYGVPQSVKCGSAGWATPMARLLST